MKTPYEITVNMNLLVSAFKLKKTDTDKMLQINLDKGYPLSILDTLSEEYENAIKDGENYTAALTLFTILDIELHWATVEFLVETIN